MRLDSIKECTDLIHNIYLGYRYEGGEADYTYWCESSQVGAKCIGRMWMTASSGDYYKTESEAKAACDERLRNPSITCKVGDGCSDCRLTSCYD